MARSYQPGMLVVDRTVTGEYENYTTPEQEVPNEPLPFPWETCMTMGDSWSYVPNDNYKSSHKLIQLLVKIVSRGGNFLLNIGPGPDGDWDPAAYSPLTISIIPSQKEVKLFMLSIYRRQMPFRFPTRLY